MFDLDRWNEIIETMSKNLLRTFLTAFSVSWGIFILILLLGMGRGLRNGASEMFKDDAVNSIWMYPGKTSAPYKGLPVGRTVKFDNSDYDYLKEHLQGYEEIAGRYYPPGSIFTTYKDESGSFDIRSVHPGHQYIEKTIMTKGRFLNQSDLDNFTKVVVIGKEVEDRLFKGEESIGKYIVLKNISFKVVGVFTDLGSENEQRKLYIPVTTAQRAFQGNDRLHRLMFTLNTNDVGESMKIEEQVTQIMADRHDFSPDDPRAMFTSNNLEQFSRFMGLFRAIDLVVSVVGVLITLIGLIGVGNIMLITVKERTREIGIRKALGATPSSILGGIFQESIFTTFLAGSMGLILGVLILELLSSVTSAGTQPGETNMFYNPGVNIWIVLTAFGILVLGGALAGLIPAVKAARINPIEAIRSK